MNQLLLLDPKAKQITFDWEDKSMVDETNEDEVNRDADIDFDRYDYGDVLDEEPKGNIISIDSIKVFSFVDYACRQVTT